MALVLSTDYITPAELTGYVREALADLPQNAFGLEEFLPNVPTDDIDYRADVGGGGLRRAASFRAWDAESPISGRRGISQISGSLPPLSEKRRLGEYDRLKLRNLPEAVTNAIFNDAVDLASNLYTRMEIARGEAIFTGKVTLNENGLYGIEADFGRAANHTQTAGTFWNVDGSNPIDNFLAWQQIYVNTNGVRPGVTLTDQTVVSALMRNEAIRAMTLPAGATQQIVTVDAIDALLRSFGLPPLRIFEAQVEGIDGVAQPLIPSGTIVFMPPAGRKLGETLWGVTAESMDADYGIDSADAPGVVVGSYSDKDPVGMWTKASGVGIPVVPGTNLTLSARVLAA